MTKSKYAIPPTCSIAVEQPTQWSAALKIEMSVSGTPEAYNTARNMVIAAARTNPGTVFVLKRDGETAERFIGEATSTIEVRKLPSRPKRSER